VLLSTLTINEGFNYALRIPLPGLAEMYVNGSSSAFHGAVSKGDEAIRRTYCFIYLGPSTVFRQMLRILSYLDTIIRQKMQVIHII